MVPADFSEHFPDSKPIDQGPWCGFVRPSLIMPEDPNFDRVASIFYSECKKIPGADAVHYYSVDPFHEGGRTEEIDLFDYSTRVYNTMLKMDPDAVWMFQGWTASPKPEMLTAIPDGRAIVTALSAKADCKAGIYSGAPWIYCAVYCYGGQYNFSGNVEGVLEGSFNALDRDDTNVIGMGYMPESVNCNEIIYEIYSRNTFGNKSNLESFIPYYLNTRYGFCDDKLADVWTRFSKEVLNGTTLKSGESALCARPSLTVKNTSYWGNKPNPFVDQSIIIEYISVMLQYYDRLKESAGYRKDLMEATRQAISNLSWYYAHMIPVAYESKDIDALSYYGKEMLSLIDIQEAVVATDPDMLLGKWLEKAKRHGKTPAEKAYFEWNARVQITLWANREGAKLLRDYAAKEWQGLLSDFYRPRWESFITRLELSLFTKTPLEAINNYDEELPFVYRKNQYPTEPIGDLRTAVSVALEKLCATKIVHKEETEAQPDFETNVAQTFS